MSDWQRMDFRFFNGYIIDPDKEYKLSLKIEFSNLDYDRELVEGKDYEIERIGKRLWWKYYNSEGILCDTYAGKGDFYMVVDGAGPNGCTVVHDYIVYAKLEGVHNVPS